MCISRRWHLKDKQIAQVGPSLERKLIGLTFWRSGSHLTDPFLELESSVLSEVVSGRQAPSVLTFLSNFQD